MDPEIDPRARGWLLEMQKFVANPMRVDTVESGANTIICSSKANTYTHRNRSTVFPIDAVQKDCAI